AHLTSPASAAFIELGNAQSRAKSNRNLVEPSGNLVLSPVVIAMWKPMAEAIGWSRNPVGWAEILALARDPAGWETYGHAEWGAEPNLACPLVAIYPREGTFWSDHPVGIVQRDWVTAEHKEAAKMYIDYLLARPQQEKAMTYGLRPGDPNVPLAAPFDAAHGV